MNMRLASRVTSSRLFSPFKAFAKTLRHRYEVRHLAELDDRTLKDIGLVRSDVEAALSVPFYTNPSDTLFRSAKRRVPQKMQPTKSTRPVVPMMKAC